MIVIAGNIRVIPFPHGAAAILTGPCLPKAGLEQHLREAVTSPKPGAANRVTLQVQGLIRLFSAGSMPFLMGHGTSRGLGPCRNHAWKPWAVAGRGPQSGREN